MAWNFDTKLLI